VTASGLGGREAFITRIYQVALGICVSCTGDLMDLIFTFLLLNFNVYGRVASFFELSVGKPPFTAFVAAAS